MKTSQLAAVPAVLSLIAVCFVLPDSACAYQGNSGNAPGQQKREPLIPIGNLDAYPTLVQTGTHPTLTWSIQYPESSNDIITIDNDGTVTTNEDLCVEFRVLGASFQAGYDRRGRPNWLDTEVMVHVNGSWVQLFRGKQNKIKPSRVYHSAAVPKNAQLEFAARGYSGSSWYNWRSTSLSSPNVIALVNGDYPPSYAPAYQQGNIESFLDPYLDGAGRVSIGPKDVLFLWELSTASPGSPYFDMQDMVVLATFDYCKNNNGHGNNLDGVDVSNPGQGGGGPNGQDDPSGNIDDER